jgi:transcriptional regulator with XRE-family HTH domain
MTDAIIPRTDKFGARLALLRWHMGWNQKEAAAACGLSQASWRGWETEGRDPRDLVGTVSKICERTGVDEYWMLTGKTSVQQIVRDSFESSGPNGVA